MSRAPRVAGLRRTAAGSDVRCKPDSPEGGAHKAALCVTAAKPDSRVPLVRGVGRPGAGPARGAARVNAGGHAARPCRARDGPGRGRVCNVPHRAASRAHRASWGLLRVVPLSLLVVIADALRDGVIVSPAASTRVRSRRPAAMFL